MSDPIQKLKELQKKKTIPNSSKKNTKKPTKKISKKKTTRKK
jgi:hypothetical protein